ncbi:MAG: dUTP diphosphatase [Candidatus Falkowbacteria bacterium]
MANLLVERITPTAKLPNRAHDTDAGLDLYADETVILAPGEYRYIKTGIRLAITDGHVGLIWDKSGIAGKGLHCLAGVIDSGYRGEIMINIVNLNPHEHRIEAGQKITQLLIQRIEIHDIVETGLDNDTYRGAEGFGSTGLK